jgi:glycosyltransferase involved in cell wall biosynthesis
MTPVIVNDLGALPEVVEDSQGGFVYRSESELNSAMDKLASDSNLRAELGQNGHSAFIQFWNEDAHMDRYLGLIERLMREKGDPPDRITGRSKVSAVSV